MPKMKIKIMSALFMLCLIAASAVFTLQANADEMTSSENKPKNATGLEKISRADSCAEAINAAEEEIANCKTYDDYERLVSALKEKLEKPDVKNADALSYAVGKARYAQLGYLSRSNNIESGRIYMSVGDQYYEEALEYMDRATQKATCKDVALDAGFVRTMIFKDRFQPEKSEAAFDDMLNKILTFSADPQKNKLELQRIADKFNEIGFSNYAVKLKVAYASKVDQKTAQDIFQDIKKSADKLFAQNNFKEAANLYDRYTSDAQAYFPKDEMAAGIMDIGERYFSASRYKEARRYYDLYAERYIDSNVIDYCNYKIALCYYYEKDYVKAVSHLEAFLEKYKNSVWFDKAFETLCRLYYENFDKSTAIKGLQRIIDNYYRKNTGDYAEVLIGLLYYGSKDYDKAAARFKKIESTSIYNYAATTLLDDIKGIKSGGAPSYGLDSANTYRIWEPYSPVNADIIPSGLETTRTEDDTPKIEVSKGAEISLKLEGAEDLDRFAVYLQDKEDLSRLPKKIKEETEKDLLTLQWSCDAGKFVDDKETKDKTWQAPDQPGTYKISVRVDDFGLVRIPDKGIRKDSTKDANLIVVVRE